MALDVLAIIENFFSHLDLPQKRIYNLKGSSTALLLSMVRVPFVMVEHTEKDARALWEDVAFYRRAVGSRSGDVCFIPSSNGPERSGERARAIYRMFCEGSASSMVTSDESAHEDVWSPESVREHVIHLRKGEEVSRAEVGQRLAGLGYGRVPLVAEKGQYSLRGYILDVFPSTSPVPYRVEFFGDEMESIRCFDLESQRSVEEVGGLEVFPATEPDEGVSLFGLQGDRRVFLSESAEGDVSRGAVLISRYSIAGDGVDAGLLSMSGFGVLPEERKDIFGLPAVLNVMSREHRVVVVASSGGQAERLKEVFSDQGVVCPLVGLEELARYPGRLSITVGRLSSGIFLPGLLILAEKEILGARPEYRPMKKSKASGLLRSIDDLHVGDYVVHADRGVGRFEGLVHQNVEGYEYDMLSIRYDGGDRLYIPLHAIEKVRKFHVEDGLEPKLDSLGTKRWQKTKERVRKSIKEMARRLVRIYAEREVYPGTRFSPDTAMHREFESFFPYDETGDQTTVVMEITQDMESERPMERLLSGDVGYGKTEVAMRAAFKAVYDGRQVAVLVPTTLLCEQHERIFRQRFSAFPVVIESLSRFKSRRERLLTVERLRKGEVDIVIGTHALLAPGVSFRALGLLVIDEEHRFGVRQKERIKDIKRGVDVLSLSATPIPRTLQMSLSGIRSMSVIETPPEERIAVKSEVSIYDEGLIRKAVDKELARGGQVFFVHNRIRDIGKVEKRLRETVPLARLAVAHGRMPEGELEKVMLSFLHGEVDVLLSTAIIGSGLDIPTANTIIINNAHQMGLADLYQLRGRVGRSNVRAFAYYLIPPGGAFTEDALRRLQAVQELSYMGAGFRLAMKDLEIRGAGNLLGAEQSGNINAVGFDLYMEMLEQAVAELKGFDIKKKKTPSINIRLNAFIPETYIEDMALRLSVYRNISSASKESDLKEIQDEMTDRFGRPPEEFANLLRIKELSLLAGELSITEINRSDGRVRFALSADSPLRADMVLRPFQHTVRFLDGGFELSLGGDVYVEIREMLKTLSGECPPCP